MLGHMLSAILLAAATVASSTPHLHARQSSAVVLKVTDFIAFMADPYVEGAQSNLSFHITDSRPEFRAEVDCVIPNTYFNLYAISALFDWCGERELGFDYSYRENGLQVRRQWNIGNGSYVMGSYNAPTSWVEEGLGANVTTYPQGKLFKRESEWLFPLSVRATTPP